MRARKKLPKGKCLSVVHVPFHGEEIEAAQEDGRVLIPIRRVCERLGLAEQSQLLKLRGAAWATVTMIVTVAEDGKRRSIACVDVDGLAMWLATIAPGRVKVPAVGGAVAVRLERGEGCVGERRRGQAAPPPPARAGIAPRTARASRASRASWRASAIRRTACSSPRPSASRAAWQRSATFPART